MLLRTTLSSSALSAAAALTACGSPSSSASSATSAETRDVSTDEANLAAAYGDNGTAVQAGTLAACDTTGGPSGNGGFAVTGATCFNFTPAEAGLPSGGVNATVSQFAVRPTPRSAAPTQLVLFLVGSGAVPADVLRTGDAALNVYGAAVSDGDAILGLSYDNTASIHDACGEVDSCYFPTRQSVILGTDEPGSMVSDTRDEGILDRTATSLRFLAASDPDGGWDAFLTTLDAHARAATAIDWSRIIVSGHSQGGGHAAAIGKLFPVLRVVQLSSTCDEVNDAAVTWTDGSSGTWMSDPTRFYGFAAPSTPSGHTFIGDSTCPYHTANWANFGMITSHQVNDADTCGAVGDTHSASLICSTNYLAWKNLYK